MLWLQLCLFIFSLIVEATSISTGGNVITARPLVSANINRHKHPAILQPPGRHSSAGKAAFTDQDLRPLSRNPEVIHDDDLLNEDQYSPIGNQENLGDSLARQCPIDTDATWRYSASVRSTKSSIKIQLEIDCTFQGADIRCAASVSDRELDRINMMLPRSIDGDRLDRRAECGFARFTTEPFEMVHDSYELPLKFHKIFGPRSQRFVYLELLKSFGRSCLGREVKLVGVGRALMAVMFDISGMCGHESVFWFSTSRAAKFYERLGFRKFRPLMQEYKNLFIADSDVFAPQLIRSSDLKFIEDYNQDDSDFGALSWIINAWRKLKRSLFNK